MPRTRTWLAAAVIALFLVPTLPVASTEPPVNTVSGLPGGNATFADRNGGSVPGRLLLPSDAVVTSASASVTGLPVQSTENAIWGNGPGLAANGTSSGVVLRDGTLQLPGTGGRYFFQDNAGGFGTDTMKDAVLDGDTATIATTSPAFSNSGGGRWAYRRSVEAVDPQNQEYINDPSGNTYMLFHLNENSGMNPRDSSGNGFQATLPSQNLWTNDSRFGPSAVKLDGQSALVATPTFDSSFYFNGIVELWFKLDTDFVSGNNITLASYDNGASSAFRLEISANGSLRMNFTRLTVRYQNGSFGMLDFEFYGRQRQWVHNTWYHAAGFWWYKFQGLDWNNSAVLTVNGEMDGYGVLRGAYQFSTFFKNGYVWRFGSYLGQKNWLKGTMDEIQLSSKPDNTYYRPNVPRDRTGELVTIPLAVPPGRVADPVKEVRVTDEKGNEVASQVGGVRRNAGGAVVGFNVTFPVTLPGLTEPKKASANFFVWYANPLATAPAYPTDLTYTDPAGDLKYITVQNSRYSARFGNGYQGAVLYAVDLMSGGNPTPFITLLGDAMKYNLSDADDAGNGGPRPIWKVNERGPLFIEGQVTFGAMEAVFRFYRNSSRIDLVKTLSQVMGYGLGARFATVSATSVSYYFDSGSFPAPASASYPQWRYGWSRLPNDAGTTVHYRTGDKTGLAAFWQGSSYYAGLQPGNLTLLGVQGSPGMPPNMGNYDLRDRVLATYFVFSATTTEVTAMKDRFTREYLYPLTLSSGQESSQYLPTGTLTTPAFTMPHTATLNMNISAPAGTSYSVDVLDEQGTPVMNGLVAGSAISSAAGGKRVALRLNLQTSQDSTSPRLYSWSVESRVDRFLREPSTAMPLQFDSTRIEPGRGLLLKRSNQIVRDWAASPNGPDASTRNFAFAANSGGDVGMVWDTYVQVGFNTEARLNGILLNGTTGQQKSAPRMFYSRQNVDLSSVKIAPGPAGGFILVLVESPYNGFLDSTLWGDTCDAAFSACSNVALQTWNAFSGDWYTPLALSSTASGAPRLAMTRERGDIALMLAAYDLNWANPRAVYLAAYTRIYASFSASLQVDEGDVTTVVWTEYSERYYTLRLGQYDKQASPRILPFTVSAGYLQIQLPRIALDDNRNIFLLWSASTTLQADPGTPFIQKFSPEGVPLTNPRRATTNLATSYPLGLHVRGGEVEVVTMEYMPPYSTFPVKNTLFSNDLATVLRSDFPAFQISPGPFGLPECFATPGGRTLVGFFDYSNRGNMYKYHSPLEPAGTAWTPPVDLGAAPSSFGNASLNFKPADGAVSYLVSTSADGSNWSKPLEFTDLAGVSIPPMRFIMLGFGLKSGPNPGGDSLRLTGGGQDYLRYGWNGTFTSLPFEIDGHRTDTLNLSALFTRPNGTGITFGFSDDNGTTWAAATPGTASPAPTGDSVLRVRANLSSNDGSATPALSDLGAAAGVSFFPEDVRIDFGDDGSPEFSMDGLLEDESWLDGTNLTVALNAYLDAHRVGAANGSIPVPVNITSNSSGIVHFGSLSVAYNRKPVATPLSPADGGSITGTAVTLAWDGSDPDSPPGNITYDLYMDGTNGTTLLAPGLKALNYTVSNLTTGTYYWRVVPRDEVSAGHFNGSTAWRFNFTFKVPNTPPIARLLSPAEGTVLNSTAVAFSWSGEDVDGQNLTYTLRVSGGSGGPIEVSNLTANSTTVTGLRDRTAYSWTVIPSDGLVEGACLDGLRNFTVNISLGNLPPVISQLPGITLAKGKSKTIDLSKYGSDPDDPAINLAWSITGAGSGKYFTASLNGTTLKVEGNGAGRESIRLRLSDPKGGFAEATVDVQVTAPAGGGRGLGETTVAAIALAVLLLAVGAVAAVAMKRRKPKEAPPPAPAAAQQVARPAPPPPPPPPPAPAARPAPQAARVPPAAPQMASDASRRGVASGDATPVAATVAKAMSAAAPEAGELAGGVRGTVVAKAAEQDFAVEDVFLIYQDGRLLHHLSRSIRPDSDDMVLTSMLTAVQDFVREGLSRGDSAPLGSMEYGRNTILLERGLYVILAVVVHGREVPGLREEMSDAVRSVEADLTSILPHWDGNMASVAAAKKHLTRVAAFMPTKIGRDEQVTIDVKVLTELEFYQGFVRFKAAVKNSTPTVVTDVLLRIMYNEKALRLDHIEPHYPMKGAEVEIGIVSPKEKKSVAFYLDPQTCMESYIDGTVSFKDATGELHTTTIKRKLVSVVCPIMYTDENINTAMLKRMVGEELEQKDSKIFKTPPFLAPERAFEISKRAVQGHDVRHVRDFVEKDPFIGEAWYYGKTKGRNDKIVIRVTVRKDTSTVEYFAASGSLLVITGLLAELKNDLNSELKREKVTVEKPIEMVLDEEIKAKARGAGLLLEKMSEGEAGAGDTEVR